MVIGLSPINPAAIDSVRPCVEPVIYSFEGSSRAVIGGGGRPGHIASQAPAEGNLGKKVQLTAQGTENARGNFERTVSIARSSAFVVQHGVDGLQFENAVQIQGGHYGVRGPLGIGIISGHDTSANAESTADGRINVLFRRSNGTLLVRWEGFPNPPASNVYLQSTI
jgi:hypothetical protein